MKDFPRLFSEVELANPLRMNVQLICPLCFICKFFFTHHTAQPFHYLTQSSFRSPHIRLTELVHFEVRAVFNYTDFDSWIQLLKVENMDPSAQSYSVLHSFRFQLDPSPLEPCNLDRLYPFRKKSNALRRQQ